MIDTQHLMLFSLILMRISGCILFNPILGRKNIPATAKAGFIMVLAYVVYTVSGETRVEAVTAVQYGILLLKEFAVGYGVGFVINLFLYFIIFAGELIDLQMGISIAKLYDPQSNSSISLSATLYNAVFLLLFFVTDGHLALIKILISSGNILPYGDIFIHSGISSEVINIFCQCTVLAIKFSFPIFAVEFLAEIGVGILMKTIPQINVFVVNIQAKLFVGLLMLLLLFLPMSSFLEEIIHLMLQTVYNFFVIMH